MPGYWRRFVPKRGSGKVLSFTSAATTVVGTVASCQPLGTNFGVEMISPLAFTLVEVCSVQPSCRGSVASGAALAGGVVWASRDESRKTWIRIKRGRASRLPEFMVLL